MPRCSHWLLVDYGSAWGGRILALPDAVYDSQHMGSFNLVVVTDSPEIVDEVMGELSLELCDVLDEVVLAATVTEEQFVNETTGTARQARRRGVAL